MPALKKIAVPDHVSALIRHLHPRIKKIIRDGFEVLAADPGVGKDLNDELAGYKSLRIGRYRIIYKVERSAVRIEAVGHRSIIYSETLRFLQKRN